ncbi:hypothetical protein QNO07_18950 [Streptomyces sp. 549]|uniref:hypothetical protein n=1 Tax=Streptomyces sp. 549 TaxID=3049076 RepID=UPI0024C3AFC4|nr:hypothetical protein [Streptomyces sp. 549]MDK1475472.1 hypothetical protein [Streptomyces sp. 549]
MEALVTVVALLAMTALGVFLIHRLNSQHRDRIAAFRYSRPGVPPASPDLPAREKSRGGAAANGTGTRSAHRRGRGRHPLRRRTHGPTG